MIKYALTTSRWQLLAAGADTKSEADAAMCDLSESAKSSAEMARIVAGMPIGPQSSRYRRVLVRERGEAGTSAEDGTVTRLRRGELACSGDRGVAFLCNGLGDQYRGMGVGLYRDERSFRRWVDVVSDLFATESGNDPRDYLLADASSRTRDELWRSLLTQGGQHAELLEDIDVTTAAGAVFTFEYALVQALAYWGVQPTAVIGYSFGEYVAATVAGILDLPDAVRLICARCELLARAPSGAMAAVQAAPPDVERYLATDTWIAAFNGTAHTVIAGKPDSVARSIVALSDAGYASRRLPAAHALHSPLVESVRPELEAVFRSATLRAPNIRTMSVVTAKWLTPQEAVNPLYWGRQLVAPVRFSDAMARVLDSSTGAILDIGPGTTLSALTSQHPHCSQGQRANVIAVAKSKSEVCADTERFLTALGRLWLSGVEMCWAGTS